MILRTLIAVATTQPASPAEDSYNLYSITGVIAITFVLVEIIKRMVKPTTPILGHIPVLLFPLIIAPILALAANKLMFQDDGTPFLSGNVWTVLGRSILGAASSSGLYTWLANPKTTVGEAQPLIGKSQSSEDNYMRPNFMILLPLFCLVGCACPEKAILREGMDQGTRQIRENEKAWAEKLVAYPPGTVDPRDGKASTGKNKATEIPPLTPAQYKNGQKAHEDYENLVNQDREAK